MKLGIWLQLAEIDHSTEQWKVLSRQIFETSHVLITFLQGGAFMRPPKWTKKYGAQKMLSGFIQFPFSGTPLWSQLAWVCVGWWPQPETLIGPFDSLRSLVPWRTSPPAVRTRRPGAHRLFFSQKPSWVGFGDSNSSPKKMGASKN